MASSTRDVDTAILPTLKDTMTAEEAQKGFFYWATQSIHLTDAAQNDGDMKYLSEDHEVWRNLNEWLVRCILCGNARGSAILMLWFIRNATWRSFQRPSLQ